MAEYIEREAVINRLLKVCMTNDLYGMGIQTGVDHAIDVIKEAPAADVAPVVHGRWKYYHKQNKAVCTNCSFERDLDANFGRAISCPNCRAKMDVPDINIV